MQNNNSSSTRFQLEGNSKETRTNLMCLKCETFCIYYVNIPKNMRLIYPVMWMMIIFTSRA